MPGASTSSATVTPTQPRKRKADQRKLFSSWAYRTRDKLEKLKIVLNFRDQTNIVDYLNYISWRLRFGQFYPFMI